MLWIIIAISAGIAAFVWLGIDSDEDSLISEDLPYNRTYKEYIKDFGDLEFIYAVIQVPEKKDHADQSGRILAARAAESLGNKLAPFVKTGELLEVVVRYNLPKLEKRFLLYQDPEDLLKYTTQLKSSFSGLKLLIESSNIVDMLKGIKEFLGDSISNSPQNGQASPGKLKLGSMILEKLFTGIDAAASGKPILNPPEIFPPVPHEKLRLESHLFTQKGSDPKNYDPTKPGVVIVQILPRKDFSSLQVIVNPLKHIRTALNKTRSEFPSLKMGITGRPVIHADEMQVTNMDVTVATCIAFPLIALIFFLLFRSVLRPLLALLGLGLALSCTYGFAAIVIGKLNLLSIVFTLILIGLGIDFGIHILARYLEELGNGKTVKEAAVNGVFLAGRGCVAAAITSVVAFLSVLFTDFAGLAELGLISGAGIIFSLAVGITFLPAALCLLDSKHNKDCHAAKQLNLLPFLDVGIRFWRPILIITPILTLPLLPFALSVGLDRNLLDLQANGLESVAYERILIQSSEISTWEAICIVKTKKEAEALKERMRRLPEVKDAQTFGSLLPPNVTKSRLILAKTFKTLSEIHPKPVDTTIDMKALKTVLNNLAAFGNQFPKSVIPPEWKKIIKNLVSASRSLSQPKVSEEEIKQKLVSYQERFLNGAQDNFRAWLDVFQPPTATWDDLPEGLRRRFVSEKAGIKQYLVRIWPKGNAWKFPVLEKFVKAIRKESSRTDFNVITTGVAINFYESVKVMENAFMTAFLIALGCVFVLVFIDMESIRFTLLAIGILLLGVLWTTEAMNLLGLKVNLANFFAFPVILGIGIDSSFHLIHRFRENGGKHQCLSPITATAVILSSLTSLIGLGSLMFARHKGLASFGMLLAIGTALCLTSSLVVLPAVLCFFERKKKNKAAS